MVRITRKHRRTFSWFVAGLLMLPCILALTAWIWSSRYGGYVRRTGAVDCDLHIERNVILLSFNRGNPGAASRWAFAKWPEVAENMDSWPNIKLGPRWWNRIGFCHAIGSTGTGVPIHQWIVPDWFGLFMSWLLLAVYGFVFGIAKARWPKDSAHAADTTSAPRRSDARSAERHEGKLGTTTRLN